ncbi:putative neutral sphingomyelinase [Lutzomyia longipalpis]|uniref:putative neutral sphingomyelinase n=1 Tax=Lutzomyia longipalpis TaxID=7200 RepID=UPI00248441E9|nr:putative neutral sphingomyelinase [Lutzomyia longipalpis]
MNYIHLSVLTINIWGIPFVSKDREVRVQRIAAELSTGKYDVVSLQEVWSEADYQYIKSQTELVLPYSHYFYSGVVGSGLCVLSAYPITAAFFHAWSVNGYVHRIQHGDWFGGKGVGLCRIAIQGHTINFYTAHLHAEYNRQSDEYMAHRVIQAFDTAQFIQQTRSDSVVQILAGDLNTEPGDLAYRVLLSTSQLRDAYQKGAPHGTNECPRNPYTSLESHQTIPDGKRIDYILYRVGDGSRLANASYTILTPEDCLSDHEAVHAKLNIVPPKLSRESSLEHIGDDVEIPELETFDAAINPLETSLLTDLTESIQICEDSLKQLDSSRKFYLWMSFAIIITLIMFSDFEAPYGFQMAYISVRVLLAILMGYFLFMGTLWNIIERHGILAGKLEMEIALRNIPNHGAGT